VHLTLGGLLFLLNGLGYAGLLILIIVAAIAPYPLIARFDWFPRLALIGYTAMTIAGYLVMGPFFALGWITKGVELVLIALVVVDVIRVYGSPWSMVRRAIASVAGNGRLLEVSASDVDSRAEQAPVVTSAQESA
jgi:hypothetical protein